MVSGICVQEKETLWIKSKVFLSCEGYAKFSAYVSPKSRHMAFGRFSRWLLLGWLLCVKPSNTVLEVNPGCLLSSRSESRWKSGVCHYHSPNKNKQYILSTVWKLDKTMNSTMMAEHTTKWKTQMQRLHVCSKIRVQWRITECQYVMYVWGWL